MGFVGHPHLAPIVQIPVLKTFIEPLLRGDGVPSSGVLVWRGAAEVFTISETQIGLLNIVWTARTHQSCWRTPT